MIGKEPLAKMLDIAVSRALRHEMASYDSERVSAVQGIVRLEFAEMIRANGTRIRGIPKSEFMLELERSRDRILAARDRALAELNELRERAGVLYQVRTDVRELEDLERSEGTERAVEVQGELARRFRAILRRSSESPARALSDELARAAVDLLRAETERAADERERRVGEKLGRFERRIAKLTDSLEQTESALSRLSRLKDNDEGIASIYRSVQGLESDVGNFELKRAVLEQIFEANLVLQKSAG